MQRPRNRSSALNSLLSSVPDYKRIYTIENGARELSLINGGSGAPASQTKTHGVTLTLSSTTPTRSGYTQLFQQLFYIADHVYGGNLPIPVHFLMDEFSNVSLPDDFDKILSVMRSRGVSVSIILKSHDPSQRANGFLTLAGGVVITFAKEILNLITGG